MGVVPPAAGFNAGLAEIAHRARRAADPRRGDDRLPGRPRRLGRLSERAGEPTADLYTFGKVMGGGLPAAAFGGRAEIMALLAPAGPVYQAGTLSGNPARLRGRPGHAARVHRRGLRAAGRDRRRSIGDLAVAGADRGRRAAPAAVRRQHVLDLLHRRRRCRTTTPPGPRTSPRSRRSSTRCWRAGSTCRRRRSRRGSSRPRSTTPRWRSSRRRCRRRRAAAAAAGRAAADRERPGVSDETVVHLLRHGEVENPTKILYGRLPGSGCPPLGEQMAKAAAQSLAGRDITHVVASPLERAQQTAEPIAAQFGLPIAVDERLIESANFFEGKRVGVGDGALRDPRNWWVLRDPFTPVVGRELQRRSRQRMYAALQAARDRGRGARGGLRLAPAADLDPAPAPGAQAPLARPAPAPVRAGQPDQLPLRRRHPRRHRLQRAGGPPRRPVAGRRTGQGRLMPLCRDRLDRWSLAAA